MAKRITAAMADEAHKHFMATLRKEASKFGGEEAYAELKGDGAFAKWLSRRWFKKFIAAGGKAGDWKAWVTYILENLPALIKIIMAFLA